MPFLYIAPLIFILTGVIVGMVVGREIIQIALKAHAKNGTLYALTYNGTRYYRILEVSADYPVDNWQAWLDAQAWKETV